MAKYSNSHKSKENKEKVKYDKVVNGKVKVQKKNKAKKFAEMFILEDLSKVKDQIIMDVLVPALKKSIVDMVETGVRMIFYGETSTEARRSGGSKVRTSYSKYYSNDSAKTTNRRAGFSFENVVFDDRDEARSVLNCLDEAIETYGTISVADLYDLSGITPESSYYNYGWDDIREARVLPCSGGYKIQFPRVIPLR